MKKYLIKSCIIATLLAGAFISCSDDDNAKPTVEVKWEEGAFILNEGSYNGNNAKISYYNKESGKLVDDVFKAQNGKVLGGGAQDIVIYGGKMYITVTESNMIYITDLKAKIVEGGEISLPAKYSPRHIATHKGFVYISSYDGALAKLDTTSLKIVKELPVEKFSERIAVAGDELYIANSKFDNTVNGNTVSIVDLNTFTLKDPISVIENPTIVVNDEKSGNLFVCAPYANKEVTIINAKTKETSTIKGSKANFITLQKERLLIYNMDFFATPATTEFSQYNISTGEFSNTSFLNVTSIPESERGEMNNLYHISIDPKNNDMYIATSDYSTTGSMYIFDENGNYKKHFKSGGVGPQKTVFVSYKQEIID